MTPCDATFDSVLWFGFCLGVLAMTGLMMIAVGLGTRRDRSQG